jgi:hypothetical protein
VDARLGNIADLQSLVDPNSKGKEKLDAVRNALKEIKFRHTDVQNIERDLEKIEATLILSIEYYMERFGEQLNSTPKEIEETKEYAQVSEQ